VAPTKKQILGNLIRLGIPPASANRVYEILGAGAVSEIRQDPYLLARMKERMAWREIDQLAASLGFNEQSPERAAGAVRHILHSAMSDGHVFLPRSEILRHAAGYLGFEDEAGIDNAVSALRQRREVVASEPYADDDPAVYLHFLYKAEYGIAERLHHLARSSSAMVLRSPTPEEMQQVERELQLSLAQAQQEAVFASLEHKMVIITGGPGTGKTTIIRGALHLWEQRGARILLAAPTGRAAKRLSESTGRPAATLHRTLEYNPDAGGFGRNAVRPLRVDCMVVDEVSMIDTELMATLLEALPPSCHLLLVGDVDQLPAVGPGLVLHDLIECECFKTIRLTEIHRQQTGSLIPLNAQRINRGLTPEMEGGGVEEGQDFFFIQNNSDRQTREVILEMVTNRIPRQFGFDPKTDIQVLCPMIKKEAGVEIMNESLQQALNASAPRFKTPLYSLAIGDKVMQTKNDYKKDVFNGDIGLVSDIDEKEKAVFLLFEGRTVRYEWRELENTALAYAITVHKSQGSEYPAVVLPLVTAHFPMLQRNLLYTAVSRGKRLVVLVGSRRALEIAVHNNKIRMRYTLLSRRLQQAFRTAAPI